LEYSLYVAPIKVFDDVYRGDGVVSPRASFRCLEQVAEANARPAEVVGKVDLLGLVSIPATNL
jgi:hypothetical protein